MGKSCKSQQGPSELPDTKSPAVFSFPEKSRLFSGEFCRVSRDRRIDFAAISAILILMILFSSTGVKK